MEDSQKIKNKIINDRSFRKEIVKESLYWFGHTYLAHYILYPTAPFQKDIYNAPVFIVFITVIATTLTTAVGVVIGSSID